MKIKTNRNIKTERPAERTHIKNELMTERNKEINNYLKNG